MLQRGAEVQFGEDVYVPAGTTTPSVVAFGGDITVDGTVTDAVVAFGGDVTIRGTVGTSTVVFGGDVTVGPDAVLGSDLKTSDASLVLFGGKLTQAPGAEIVGQTETFKGVDLGGAFGWAAKGIFVDPGFSFIGWLLQTAFCLVLALVIAALMPKQLRTVQQNVGRRPWASLGWGALVFFVVAPAVLLVLVISIIGLLLVLPYLLCVLLAYFIATTGAAAFLAQRVLTGFGGKENLMLAVTIGVVGTTVISQIPVAGPLLMLVLMVFGIGAAAIGAADWRRRRREAAGAGGGPGRGSGAVRGGGRRGGAAVRHHPDGVHRPGRARGRRPGDRRHGPAAGGAGGGSGDAGRAAGRARGSAAAAAAQPPAETPGAAAPDGRARGDHGRRRAGRTGGGRGSIGSGA